MSTKTLNPEFIRRRNRLVSVVLLLAALAAAVIGTLYLRQYGFSTEDAKEDTRFH